MKEGKSYSHLFLMVLQGDQLQLFPERKRDRLSSAVKHRQICSCEKSLTTAAFPHQHANATPHGESLQLCVLVEGIQEMMESIIIIFCSNFIKKLQVLSARCIILDQTCFKDLNSFTFRRKDWDQIHKIYSVSLLST